MLPAVLFAVLAQAQPLKLVIVQGSNLGVSDPRAAELSRAVIELARLEGFDAAAVNPQCEAMKCYLDAARDAGADAMIAVSFAAVGKDAVMDLDCRRPGGGDSIAQVTLTVRSKTPGELVFEHLPFLRRIKKALEPVDVLPELPAQPPELPEPPPQPQQVVPAQPAPVVTPVTSRRAALAWLTGAASFGAFVAGAVLFSVNAVEAASLGRVLSPKGLIPGGRVEQARAIDDRQSFAIAMMISAGVMLALTLVIALLPSSGGAE